MPKANLNNGNMYYEEHGSGTPLLITSGWAMVPKLLGLYGDVLVPHYRCILHEHCGMGRSDMPDKSLTIEQMADDLAGLMDHLEIDQCLLEGGGGMGGLVGLEFLIRHPDRVRAAHLGSPSLKLDNFTHQLFQHWKALRELDVGLWARDVTLWVYTPATFDAKPDQTETAAITRASEPTFDAPGSYNKIVDAYCAYDATDRAHLVRCPTIVSTGGIEDLLTGPRYAQAVADAIPGAQLTVFENTSHNYWVERKADWARYLLNFFAKHDKWKT